ncbi:mitochondrial import inner membrane translocase subunit TIM23-2-like [Typha angustifolia]|uniref:mitochondrial import inner membrane translocase subunit TIM23-2-like n=1 Tax=Typha angustifolia TaxID=59011 RepID=UPI003C2E9FD9
MADLYSHSSSSTHPDSGEDRRTHRVYNPYESFQNPHAMPVHQLIYDLPSSPEFLFQEESTSHRRSWGHNLSFYAGIGYLSGATAGAAKGSLAGIRAAESGESVKLRVNRVLNSSGQVGRRMGNSMGVLGLIFAGLESGISVATGDEGVMSTVVAGLGTGAVYKAASGPRSAAVAGAIGGLAAGIAVAGKHVVKRYVPI